jgi:hypothetical protein
MFIPAGYANVQFLMHDTSNQHQYLTAIGCHLEAADLEDVAAGMNSAFYGNLSPFIGNDIEAVATRVILGTSNPQEPVTVEVPSESGGTSTSDSASPNVAILIKKQTAQGGRKNRGRMYIPKPTEGGFDEAGVFSTGQYSALATAVGEMQADMEAIVGVDGLYVLHNLSTDSPTLITNLVPDRMVATQRRRLRR